MATFRLTPAGIEPLAEATGSTSGAALAPGVYTTLRIYPGHRAVRIDQHLTRLEVSAALLEQPLALDRRRVRSALRAALSATGVASARVRITATLPPPGHAGEMYLAVEALAPPEAGLYSHGVTCACLPLVRGQPRAKSTAFIAIAAAWYARKPPEIYEYVMVSPAGALLEGLTSNFFGVRAGIVYTAEEEVLAGVTREIVLELAARQGRPVCRTPVQRGEVTTLDEAFITSSSREVVPVVTIDGTAVGAGRPGAITAALLAGYRERVVQEAEEI